MLNAYRFFTIYSTIKLHFTSEYDVLKYQGKTKAISFDAFNERSDCMVYETWRKRLKSEEEAVSFCVFNWLESHDWLYHDFKIANEVYISKKKFYSALTRNIKADQELVQKIKTEKGLTFDKLINKTASGNKSPLLQMYLQHIVSLEYICMVNHSRNITDLWSSEYSNDPLVCDEVFKIKKYTPFVIKYGNL